MTPAEIDDTITTADTAAGGQPAADPAPQPAASTDPDDVELAAALADLKDEPKADATAAKPAPAATATPAAPVAAATTAEKPAGIMVPKERLDESLSKLSAKDVELARLQGENDALKLARQPAPTGATAPQATQQPIPATERLKAIADKQDALAQKFDDGEITMSAFKKEERALLAEEATIREEAWLAKTAKPAAASDLRLDEITAQLEQDHPYCSEIKDLGDWDFLARKASASLLAEGINIPAGVPLNPRDQLTLRTRIAELTDVFGESLTGKNIELKKPGTASAPAAAAGNTTLSTGAQQRLDKLTAAANHPADISTIGQAGSGAGALTDEAIASMSDEEITALPTSVRSRFKDATT